MISQPAGENGTSSISSSDSSASVLDEPLQWIARAVNFDESRDDAERRLQVPLESGRLYDSTKFASALHCLQKQQNQLQWSNSSSRRHPLRTQQPADPTRATRVDDDDHDAHQISEEDAARTPAGGPAQASKRRIKAGTSSRTVAATGSPSSMVTSSQEKILRSGVGSIGGVDPTSQGGSQPPPPPYALTPVVLSGLIAALQQQQQQRNRQDGENCPADLTSELVLACHALRRAALQRAKARNGQRFLRRLLPPLLLTLAIVTAYLRSVHKMRAALLQLRYVRSCEAGTSSTASSFESRAYESACRLAETELWERFGNNFLDVADPPSSSSSSSGTSGESFSSTLLAMHSVLAKSVLTRQDVETGRRVNPARHPATMNYHRRSSGEGGGESVVNRLVREAIERYRDPNLGLSVLDVGCGVGGTLYSLLPLYRNATRGSAASFRRSRYHGITLSTAEVHHATQMMGRRLPNLKELEVLFEQRSFDDVAIASGPTIGGESNRQQIPYSVIIAVESLSYSRNLKETLANVLSVLPSGGIAVIVDDVVHPSDAGRLARDPSFKTRPSVLPHPVWDALLRENKCHVLEAYDLTFEYELVGTEKLIVMPSTKAAALQPAYWPFSSAMNLVSYSADTLWRHGVWWERWFASSGPSKRMIQLHDDRADLQRAARKRMDEYTVRESLSYVFYVCRKQ